MREESWQPASPATPHVGGTRGAGWVQMALGCPGSSVQLLTACHLLRLKPESKRT